MWQRSHILPVLLLASQGERTVVSNAEMVRRHTSIETCWQHVLCFNYLRDIELFAGVETGAPGIGRNVSCGFGRPDQMLYLTFLLERIHSSLLYRT